MLAVRAYQLGVMLGGGLLPLLLEHRAKAGREDPVRMDERKAPQHGTATVGKSRFGYMRHPLAKRARPCPCCLIFWHRSRTHIFFLQREPEPRPPW